MERLKVGLRRTTSLVAATVLREGSQKRVRVDYWLSTEVRTGPQVAELLGRELGTAIVCRIQVPDELAHCVTTVPPDAGPRLRLGERRREDAEG